MKKYVISTLSVIALLTSQIAVHANYDTTVFDNLNDDTYYTVTAQTVNSDINSDSFIFAGSKRTVIPAGEHTVYLRGVKPTDGKITAGVISKDEAVKVFNFQIADGEEYNFYIGGDITEANYIHDLGGKYYDTYGNEERPVTILRENGVKLARIRLSNNPGKGNGDSFFYLPNGYQDEADCLSLAKEAKNNGMEILFTFNLSDYWSNGERQIVPSDWVNEIKSELGYNISDPQFLKRMTDDEHQVISDKLTQLTYNYVHDIMTKLKEQDTVPKYVSIGNEINGGMLFPFGTVYDMSLNSTSLNAAWDNNPDNIFAPARHESLASFFNAGYDAVKAVSPETEVVIHLANGAVTEPFMWTLDLYNSIGVKYDIIGASYYPAWSNNTVEGCVEFCNTIYDTYNRKILIMETGFNWNSVRKDGYSGQLVDIDAYKDKYPPTPTGQKGYLADLYNGLKSVKNGACIGAIYWDPLMIHVEDPNIENASLSGWAVRESDDKTDVNVVENTTLFDFDGHALPSLAVTKNSSDIKTIITAEYSANGKLVNAKIIDTNEIVNASAVNRKIFIFGE